MKMNAACALTASLCMSGYAGSSPASIRPAFTPSRSAPSFELPEGTVPRIAADDPFRLGAGDARSPIRLAHAILVKAVPDKEATISDSPDEVLLIFNEGVGQEYLALAVVDAAGHRVDRHDAKLDFTDRSHLRASIDKLNPGRYMVRYRVLSADGHVISGKYFFQMHDAKGGSDHEPQKNP